MLRLWSHSPLWTQEQRLLAAPTLPNGAYLAPSRQGATPCRAALPCPVQPGRPPRLDRRGSCDAPGLTVASPCEYTLPCSAGCCTLPARGKVGPVGQGSLFQLAGQGALPRRSKSGGAGPGEHGVQPWARDPTGLLRTVGQGRPARSAYPVARGRASAAGCTHPGHLPCSDGQGDSHIRARPSLPGPARQGRLPDARTRPARAG